ncbi:hypothetical protein GCM10007416_29240 [Kroppenstedtia guangzhouensis]|jgi:hypothetical protein|uniref:Uncharacterized protein n=1 Tax=Kroppenstedtia guangzhouensis TaxID=1274356 RepID=A0ABQ1H036_9BACL|nr:hypothetical protein GCM10007416_29240 [Kroppenstedtia guangzhouensis]
MDLNREDFRKITRWLAGFTGGKDKKILLEQLPGATSSSLYRVKPVEPSGEKPLILGMTSPA